MKVEERLDRMTSEALFRTAPDATWDTVSRLMAESMRERL